MRMQVHRNDALEPQSIPGLVHRTLAGPRDGMRKAEVWQQTIAPGGETPLHRHDCEEVIVILSGTGACASEQGELPLTPNSTLIIPPNLVHKLANTGAEPMDLIGILTMAPVKVETAEGTAMPLPWDQSALVPA